MFKLSDYSLLIPLESANNYLLFNTISGDRVGFEDQKKVFGKKAWKATEVNDDKDLLLPLKDLGFLVNKEKSEFPMVSKRLHALRHNTNVMEVMISQTYWCNFACSYCYERKLEPKLTMSQEVYEQSVAWIEKKLKEFDSKRLHVVLFGGEVLGKLSLLETLCNGLKKVCEKREVILDFSLTTNGSLLTPQRVAKLKDLGINRIKITLDGDKTTHNKSRPFANGKGSFQVILKNLIAQSKNLDIALRCNFDRTNFQRIPKLLDILVSHNLNKQIKYLEFQPIKANAGSSEESQENSFCNHSIFSSQQIDQLLWLMRAATDRGFKIKTTLDRCPAIYESSFLINPLGDLYKCPAFLMRKESAIGSVFSQTTNSLNQAFVEGEPWRDCDDCSFLPICCGGCRYEAYEKHNDFENQRVCYKQYYEKVGTKLLALDYYQESQ